LVRDCQPSDVRVHATVNSDAGLPPYVERDHDALLRLRLQEAARSAGFILVIGGSSTGKSRSLLAAMQSLLGDWHILFPEDPAAVREASETGQIRPRTIIWLDDTPVERYITAAEDGLSGDNLKRLITEHEKVIIIDSLWPSRYEALMIHPGESTSIDLPPDISRGARDALSLARQPIRVNEQFSDAERNRAQTLARTDARLKAALMDTQFGVTQALAGAPALVRRYEDAESAEPNAYGLMTAAVDARRVGDYSPLTVDFLREAAIGYLSRRQRAMLSPEFSGMTPGQFAAALNYATDFRSNPGNVAPLVPEAGSTVGTIGYSIADYLLEYVLEQRRNLPVPEETWNALLAHTSNANDLRRVGRSAESRLLYRYAEPFYRSAVTIDPRNADLLNQWLLKHGHIDEVRQRAESDIDARQRLADWLVENKYIEELHRRASEGDSESSKKLANWLAASGEIGELRQRAREGDPFAKAWFPDSPSEQDTYRKIRAAYPSNPMSKRLADKLYDTNQIDELRALADFGDSYARRRLAGWLIKNNALDELRERADTDDAVAKKQLDQWLMKMELIDELRERSDAGDTAANRPLADLLARNGNVEELTRRADAGNASAMWRLADLLAEKGDVKELTRRADEGDKYMAGRLAHWLAQNEKIDDLRQRADRGDPSARRRLALWLVENDNIEELRVRASAGDKEASISLDVWLAENNLSELRERAKMSIDAQAMLIDKLHKDGEIEELQKLSNEGSGRASGRLAEQLAKNGQTGELIDRTLGGEIAARRQLLRLATIKLIENSDRLIRLGLNPDGTIVQDS
jgi:hypothetical protein